MTGVKRGLKAIATTFLVFTVGSCAGSEPVSEVPAPATIAPTPSQSPATAPAPPPATIPTVNWVDPLSEAELWAQLQQRDAPYFVLMRHAQAPGTGDPANFQIDDCATQRNLDAAGKEQAQQTGEAFVAQGVTVDQVLSSQWCRCLETAERLALGNVEPFSPLNSFFQDRSTEPQQTQQVLAWMGNQLGRPGVTVMVTHFVNIAAIAGNNVASGEMVVMKLTAPNQVTVLGAIAPL